MYRSAARGLGRWRSRTRLCTALAVIRTHAKRGAGMWNLTSLRAARACRKLGRVAPGPARHLHSLAGKRGSRAHHEVNGLFDIVREVAECPLRVGV